MPYVITTTTPTVLTRSGACIERTARKAHDCAGDGRATPNHADGCPSPQSIQPGSRYVEYIGESGLYQSGSAHSMPCAAAYGYLPTVSRVAVATLDETRSAVRKFVRERHGQSIARSVAGWVAGLAGLLSPAAGAALPQPRQPGAPAQRQPDARGADAAGAPLRSRSRTAPRRSRPGAPCAS